MIDSFVLKAQGKGTSFLKKEKWMSKLQQQQEDSRRKLENKLYWLHLYFCGTVYRQKALCLIFIRGHCQRFLTWQISDSLWVWSEVAQNLSLGFIEWSCAAATTTTSLRCRTQRSSLIELMVYFVKSTVISKKVHQGCKRFQTW